MVELTGEEIWEMMEKNLERTFSCDAYQQMGGYLKRCLGLKIYAKIENPKGNRVLQIFVGEKPLEREKTYTATFVTTQGVPEKYGSNRRNLDLRAIDSLKKYFFKHKSVSAELRGTVVLV